MHLSDGLASGQPRFVLMRGVYLIAWSRTYMSTDTCMHIHIYIYAHTDASIQQVFRPAAMHGKRRTHGHVCPSVGPCHVCM